MAPPSASYPGTTAQPPTPTWITSLTTGMGHARNLAVVSSGDAVIAIGGGYGTLSEIGLAATIGRPVVILGGWRLQNDEWSDGISYAASAQEAMALVREALAREADGRGGESARDGGPGAAEQGHELPGSVPAS